MMATRGVHLVPTLINIENFPAFADAAERFPAYAKHMRDLYERSDDTVAAAARPASQVHAGTDAGGYVEHGRIVDELIETMLGSSDPAAVLAAASPTRPGAGWARPNYQLGAPAILSSTRPTRWTISRYSARRSGAAIRPDRGVVGGRTIGSPRGVQIGVHELRSVR